MKFENGIKKICKKVVGAAAATALSAMLVIPTFAATVDMYGYVDKVAEDGTQIQGYMRSAHTAAMVESVAEDDEGNYVVTFKPVDMGYVQGYISSISTADGESTSTLIEGNKAVFTFSPDDVTIPVINSDGSSAGSAEATLINYTVAMSTGSHSTSRGAIAINE